MCFALHAFVINEKLLQVGGYYYIGFSSFLKKNKIGYNKILFNRFFSFPAYLSVMMLPRIAIDLFNVC